eukprot:1069075-Prymnesium_polylepis.1
MGFEKDIRAIVAQLPTVRPRSDSPAISLEPNMHTSRRSSPSRSSVRHTLLAAHAASLARPRCPIHAAVITLAILRTRLSNWRIVPISTLRASSEPPHSPRPSNSPKGIPTAPCPHPPPRANDEHSSRF